MTDIVERLRAPVDPDDPDLWKVDKDRREAAEEIERLRYMHEDMCHVAGEKIGEIERLIKEREIERKMFIAAIARHLEEIERLRRALEPFAKQAERYEPNEGDEDYRAWDSLFKIGDLRRARQAIAVGKHLGVDDLGQEWRLYPAGQ